MGWGVATKAETCIPAHTYSIPEFWMHRLPVSHPGNGWGSHPHVRDQLSHERVVWQSKNWV